VLRGRCIGWGAALVLAALAAPVLAAPPGDRKVSSGKGAAPPNVSQAGRPGASSPSNPVSPAPPAPSRGPSIAARDEPTVKQLIAPARVLFEVLRAGETRTQVFALVESDLTVSLLSEDESSTAAQMTIVAPDNKVLCDRQRLACDFHAAVAGVYRLTVKNMTAVPGNFSLVFSKPLTPFTPGKSR